MFALRSRHCAGACLLFAAAYAAAAGPSAASRLFEDRILPILRSDQPSSCSACHFSGVSIRDYLRPDQAQTFAGLRQAGLIDVDDPDASKLLTFLSRKPEQPDEALERLRQSELAAVRDWIRAAVREPQLLTARSTEHIGVELPAEVIRHARKDRVLSSFVDNIWTETARCINCHSPERNRDKIARFGQDAVDAISWFVPNDPEATLQRLENDGDIDLEHPEQSAVLTKPAGLVEHGGGPKFRPGDVAYRKFLAFLTDYSAVRKGLYRQVDDLPAAPPQIALLTGQHLRITGFPAEVEDASWKVDLYRWDSSAGHWSGQRVGAVSGRVNREQHLGQGMVHVFVDANDPELRNLRQDPKLPGGPWLAKLYVDRSRRSAADFHDEPGDEAFVGEIELRGDWPAGYRPPRIVEFTALKDAE